MGGGGHGLIRNRGHKAVGVRYPGQSSGGGCRQW